jgi:hypothetical protein
VTFRMLAHLSDHSAKSHPHKVSDEDSESYYRLYRLQTYSDNGSQDVDGAGADDDVGDGGFRDLGLLEDVDRVGHHL